MKCIEVIDFYKWATNKNQFCKKKNNESLIVHPEFSLRLNHPD